MAWSWNVGSQAISPTPANYHEGLDARLELDRTQLGIHMKCMLKQLYNIIAFRWLKMTGLIHAWQLVFSSEPQTGIKQYMPAIIDFE